MARIAIELKGKITQITIDDEEKAAEMLTAYAEHLYLSSVKDILRMWANQIKEVAIQKWSADAYTAIKDDAQARYTFTEEQDE